MGNRDCQNLQTAPKRKFILTEKEVLEIRKSGFHRHRLSTIYKSKCIYNRPYILNRTRKHI
jgi:hypothetical protein